MAQLVALIDGHIEVQRISGRRQIDLIRLAEAGKPHEIDAWLGPGVEADEDDGADDDMAAALAAFGLREVPPT